MQEPVTPLLQTYEEARLLMDAKGWPMGEAGAKLGCGHRWCPQ